MLHIRWQQRRMQNASRLLTDSQPSVEVRRRCCSLSAKCMSNNCCQGTCTSAPFAKGCIIRNVGDQCGGLLLGVCFTGPECLKRGKSVFDFSYCTVGGCTPRLLADGEECQTLSAASTDCASGGCCGSSVGM
jgi:hypothetical protein